MQIRVYTNNIKVIDDVRKVETDKDNLVIYKNNGTIVRFSEFEKFEIRE